MNTSNLNKTNITDSLLANVKEIEKFLGKEIVSVKTIKDGVTGFTLSPGDVIYQNNYPCSSFKPFSMVNRNYKFNPETGVFTIEGRNRWARKMSTIKFQLEKVGYKLNTTSLPEGYIWGNPVKI